MRDPRELGAYAILGVAGGLAAWLFAWTLRQLRPRLAALPHWTRLVQPPLAGLADRADWVSGLSSGDGGGLRDDQPGNWRRDGVEAAAGAGSC
jgi:hypothetical protein